MAEQVQTADVWSHIFLEGNDTTEERQATYFKERMADIKKGLPTWMVRVFDADAGICADFYRDGRPVGLVEHEYGSFFDAYSADPSGLPSLGRVGLLEAVRFVETLD